MCEETCDCSRLDTKPGFQRNSKEAGWTRHADVFAVKKAALTEPFPNPNALLMNKIHILGFRLYAALTPAAA